MKGHQLPQLMDVRVAPRADVDATSADPAGLARVQQQIAELRQSLPVTIVKTVTLAKKMAGVVNYRCPQKSAPQFCATLRAGGLVETRRSMLTTQYYRWRVEISYRGATLLTSVMLL